jgi:hypothetical protein
VDIRILIKFDSRSAVHEISRLTWKHKMSPCSEELAVGPYVEFAESSSQLQALFPQIDLHIHTTIPSAHDFQMLFSKHVFRREVFERISIAPCMLHIPSVYRVKFYMYIPRLVASAVDEQIGTGLTECGDTSTMILFILTGFIIYILNLILLDRLYERIGDGRNM